MTPFDPLTQVHLDPSNLQRSFRSPAAVAAEPQPPKSQSFPEASVQVTATQRPPGTFEAEGIPVHGYLHWSLVDNFEWLDGWERRFGLLELDRASLARRPRPSVETFRRLAAAYLGRPAAGR